MLEAELATICPFDERTPQSHRGNQEQDLHKLRLLLERECAAQVISSPLPEQDACTHVPCLLRRSAECLTVHQGV